MNNPNMYRVNYRVMEGNNYAGGWSERHSDISALGDVVNFSNVVSVVPIFIEVGEPLDDDVIQKAIVERRWQDEQNLKIEAVLRAKRQLQVVKDAMST